MDHRSKNGNGGAVVILPPTPKVITGASLAQRQLSKRQRAVMAADAIDGVTSLTPTQAQIALICGVSLTYVLAARKLSPGERNAILQGYDVPRFTELLAPSRQLSLVGPVIPDLKAIPDHVLQNIARSVGSERMLAAACAVEHHA
jgi:hypothetical protein